MERSLVSRGSFCNFVLFLWGYNWHSCSTSDVWYFHTIFTTQCNGHKTSYNLVKNRFCSFVLLRSIVSYCSTSLPYSFDKDVSRKYFNCKLSINVVVVQWYIYCISRQADRNFHLKMELLCSSGLVNRNK